MKKKDSQKSLNICSKGLRYPSKGEVGFESCGGGGVWKGLDMWLGVVGLTAAQAELLDSKSGPQVLSNGKAGAGLHVPVVEGAHRVVGHGRGQGQDAGSNKQIHQSAVHLVQVS